MICGETSFRERRSLRKKVSYRLVLQLLKFAPLRFAFDPIPGEKGVFVRSLKAVLAFDSRVR